MKTRKLRGGRLGNLLVVQCSWRFQRALNFQTQLDLLRGAVPRRTASTGWKATLGILAYIIYTSGFGITY